MACVDVTQLVLEVFPGSLETFRRARRGTSAYRLFTAGFVDVLYFYTSVGGSAQTFRRLLTRAYAIGRVEQGIAAGRIPESAIHLIQDLDHLWGNVPPGAYRELIEDMASQSTKFRGGQGVLRVLRGRGFSGIRALEVVSTTTRRIYDIVLSSGRSLIIEVKNYPALRRMGRDRWANSVAKQMLRDLMHTTTQSQEFIWIFFSRSEDQLRTGARLARPVTRAQVLEKMIDGMGVALFVNHRNRVTYSSLIRRLSNVTADNIDRIGTPLLRELLGSGRQFASNKQALLDAIRDLQRSNGERIFIDPS